MLAYKTPPVSPLPDVAVVIGRRMAVSPHPSGFSGSKDHTVLPSRHIGKWQSRDNARFPPATQGSWREEQSPPFCFNRSSPLLFAPILGLTLYAGGSAAVCEFVSKRWADVPIR